MASDRQSLLPHLIFVTIVEARNLKGVDWNGKSDPYVVISKKSGSEDLQLAKGEYVSNDLSPKWWETYLLVVAGRGEFFDLSVWDHNTIASNKCIGSVRVSIAEWSDRGWNDVWVSLDSKGEVRLNGLILPVPFGNIEPQIEPPYLACTPFPKRHLFLECHDYFGGTSIRGALILSAREKTKYQNVRITLRGESVYHWITISRDKNGQTHTHHHYVRAFPAKTAAYIAKCKADNENPKLPCISKYEPGLHVIPFIIHLPRDLPANDTQGNTIAYRVDVRLAKTMAVDKRISAAISCRGPLPPPIDAQEPISFTFQPFPGVNAIITAPSFAVKGERYTFELEVQNNSEVDIAHLAVESVSRTFMTTTTHGIGKYQHRSSELSNSHTSLFYVNGGSTSELFPGVSMASSWKGTLAFDVGSSWHTSSDRKYAGMTDVKNFVRFTFRGSREEEIGTKSATLRSQRAQLCIFLHNNPRHVPISKPHGIQEATDEAKIKGVILQDPLPAILPPTDSIVPIIDPNSATPQVPPRNVNLTEAYYTTQHFDGDPTRRDTKTDEISHGLWKYGRVPEIKYANKKGIPADLNMPVGMWSIIDDQNAATPS